jgi:hypothetical protein
MRHYVSHEVKKRYRSHRIVYPDGIERILTLPAYQWDWVDIAEDNGYAFNDILGTAMSLAEEFPSGKGWNFDVLDSTRYMILTIYKKIYGEERNLSNDHT